MINYKNCQFWPELKHLFLDQIWSVDTLVVQCEEDEATLQPSVGGIMNHVVEAFVVAVANDVDCQQLVALQIFFLQIFSEVFDHL